MPELRFRNGRPRATLIQRFNGSALLVGPKGEKVEFDFGTKLKEVRTKAGKFGWVIGIEHLHRLVAPMAPPIGLDSWQS